MSKVEIFMTVDNKILTDRPDLIMITNVETSMGSNIYGIKWRVWKRGSMKILPNGLQLLRKIRSRFVRCSYIIKGAVG